MRAERLVLAAALLIGLLSALPTLSLAEAPVPDAAAALKVGVIVPLTGGAASMGEGLERAITLAPHSNLELIFEDDQCDAKKALAAYHALKTKGVRVFLLACSGSVLAIAPHAKRDSNLILTGYSGSIKVRDTGAEVIRFNPDGLSLGDAIIQYLQAPERHKWRRIGLLFEEQDYAQSLAAYLNKNLSTRIVHSQSYLPNQPNFTAELLKFSSKNLDAIIFIPVSVPAARSIYQNMAEIHFKVPLIGDVNSCDYDFSPSDFGLTGVCFSAAFSNPGYQQFLGRFRERYANSTPTYPFYDAISYDIIAVLDTLAPQLRGANPAAELTARILAGVSAPVSEYQFTPDGEVQGGLKYLQHRPF